MTTLTTLEYVTPVDCAESTMRSAKRPNARRLSAEAVSENCHALLTYADRTPFDVAHYTPTTFTNKMTAERWLANERDLTERAAALGEPWISPAERVALATITKETLADYGKRWIEQRNVKPRTRIHYSSLWKDHIAPEVGKLPIDKVTSQLVRNCTRRR